MTIKMFLLFLKENGVLNSYLNNLKDNLLGNIDGAARSRFYNVNDFLLKSNPKNFLISAFSWSNTAEKANKWYKLDQEWQIVAKMLRIF